MPRLTTRNTNDKPRKAERDGAYPCVPQQSAVDTFHLAIRSLGPTAMLRDWERDGRLEELAALIDRGTPFTDIETYLRTVKGGA